ncbi:MAG: type IIL restriction-modification enzyme MmeI [Thermomicrobiales bacterium]
MFAHIDPVPLTADRPEGAGRGVGSRLDEHRAGDHRDALQRRSLDPARRSQLGAHYTGRADIRRVVDPVLMTLRDGGMR